MQDFRFKFSEDSAKLIKKALRGDDLLSFLDYIEEYKESEQMVLNFIGDEGGVRAPLFNNLS